LKHVCLREVQAPGGSFMTSFRLSHPKDVQQLLKKGKIIYGKWK